mgnify:CR=1 FL=1
MLCKPIIGNCGKGRLFNYRLDQDGKAQAKASDAVMPYIRNITKNDRKVAHSLRSNFKDLIRDLEIPKELNDFITGRAQGDVAGKYGPGPAMSKRLEWEYTNSTGIWRSTKISIRDECIMNCIL